MFDNTRQALVEFDAGKAAREAMFEGIDSDASFKTWEKADEAAIDLV